jgi:AcrR family transcriptional regulator
VSSASRPLETAEHRGERPAPTSARGRRTRAKLVDAARQVFLDTGYADANATLITGAAGVSYGSFYVYFASKEELFAEVASELLARVYVASRAPLDQEDPVERLEIENRRWFELYRENARMFQLIEEAVRADESFRALWNRLRHEHIGRLARGVRRLQDTGVVTSTLDAQYLANALGGMAERLAYLSTVDDDLDHETLLDTLNELWRHALGLSAATDRNAKE